MDVDQVNSIHTHGSMSESESGLIQTFLFGSCQGQASMASSPAQFVPIPRSRMPTSPYNAAQVQM